MFLKIFKSWQVCDWLAKWITMLRFMDVRWPRVFRHSNVDLVFLRLIVTCRLWVIYVREDNYSNVWVMIIWLIWTIWTPMSSVPKKADKLNLSLSPALLDSATSSSSSSCSSDQDNLNSTTVPGFWAAGDTGEDSSVDLTLPQEVLPLLAVSETRPVGARLAAFAPAEPAGKLLEWASLTYFGCVPARLAEATVDSHLWGPRLSARWGLFQLFLQLGILGPVNEAICATLSLGSIVWNQWLVRNLLWEVIQLGFEGI